MTDNIKQVEEEMKKVDVKMETVNAKKKCVEEERKGVKEKRKQLRELQLMEVERQKNMEEYLRGQQAKLQLKDEPSSSSKGVMQIS